MTVFTRLLVRGMEWLLIFMLGMMVVLVFSNVVLRYGFNLGITFSEEVSRFMFIWVVFLGAVLTLRDNAHLGVHMLTKKLPLAGKKACKLFSDVATLACCGSSPTAAGRSCASKSPTSHPFPAAPTS